MTPEENSMLTEVRDDLKELSKYVYENMGSRPTRTELYSAVVAGAVVAGFVIKLV